MASWVRHMKCLLGQAREMATSCRAHELASLGDRGTPMPRSSPLSHNVYSNQTAYTQSQRLFKPDSPLSHNVYSNQTSHSVTTPIQTRQPTQSQCLFCARAKNMHTDAFTHMHTIRRAQPLTLVHNMHTHNWVRKHTCTHWRSTYTHTQVYKRIRTLAQNTRM